MKKYIIAVAISSAVMMSDAQTNQAAKSKPDPKVQTERIAKNLGLTDDQKAKVLIVNTDADQKMEALSANKVAGEKMRGERKTIGKEREDKLKGILTADQFTKYMAKKEEMKQKRQANKQKK